jgi:hypothetical protein
MATDPVSDILSSLEYRMMDKSKNTVILGVVHHHQNHLELICTYMFAAFFKL